MKQRKAFHLVISRILMINKQTVSKVTSIAGTKSLVGVIIYCHLIYLSKLISYIKIEL